MAQFAIGDHVAQVLPAPVTGVVSGYALDNETGEVQVLVAYTDSNGQAQERHFAPSELAAQ